MNKFKTSVAMKVTEEQYKKDLKQPLNELGYICENTNFFKKYFVNTSMTDHNNGKYGYFSEDNAINEAYYIDTYNPELFLALSAMTENDDWDIGEYLVKYKAINYNIMFKIFKCNYLSGGSSVDGHASNHYKNMYRKATKEELIKHFSKSASIKVNHFELNDISMPKKWYCKPENDHDAKILGEWYDSTIHYTNDFYKKAFKGVKSYGISYPSYGFGKVDNYQQITFQFFLDNILNKSINNNNNNLKLNNNVKNNNENSKTVDEQINRRSKQRKSELSFGGCGDGLKTSNRNRKTRSVIIGENTRAISEELHTRRRTKRSLTV